MTTALETRVSDLLNTLHNRSVRLWLDQGQLRFEAPSGAVDEDLRAQLKAHKPALIAALQATSSPKPPRLVADPERRHEPFPLTELQQAYWVGESGVFAQSAKACYVHHVAFDTLDEAQLGKALRRLQSLHEVLRTQFLADGTQVFAPLEACACPVERFDFRRSKDAEEQVATLVRSYPDTRLPPLEEGPPLSAAVVQMPKGVRLILAVRLIVLDGPSLSILFRDLLACLFDQDVSEKDDDLSYRDYVKALNTLPRDAAEAYWDKTLPLLPPPPALPVTGASPHQSEFHRLSRTIASDDWSRLKALAQAHGLTPNAVMLALYAAVLRPWSEHAEFTLNVLTNYRPFDHPQMHALVGNHSNTVLTTCSGAGNFIAQVRAVQANLAERLPHAVLPGVALLRRLQQSQTTDRPVVPFVFTSGISTDAAQPLPDALRGRHRTIESHLRTPQVWLDHQVVETSDGLLCYWDYVGGIFEPGLPEALFKRFNATVDALLTDEEAWLRRDPLDADNFALPTLVHGPHPDPKATLASEFLRRVNAHPDACALIDADGATLTYRALAEQAGKVAQGLLAEGAQAGDLVAVHLPKSAIQVVSVIGVAMAGMAWMPLDTRLPPSRVKQILSQSGARIVLADDCMPGSVDPADFDSLNPILEAQGDSSKDLAYVIYTSGSTGVPKGVAIAHGAVLNTLYGVNCRFGIGTQDRVLALSALSFDLSVYDIWGTLLAGAAIVLPKDTDLPDPTELLAHCTRQRVTVWNSVPAFLEMVMFLPEDQVAKALPDLRVIMLSGDWIPISLARSLRRLLPAASLFSLGGATEAAIWSNYFAVDHVPDDWASIPYGFALSGQQIHVLDQSGRQCPRIATGEIYIEGFGLAEGYYKDPERTDQHFITHSSGRRLYKTGDLGRYKSDGAIEFLGRSDLQLKLRGFRIEAGEVEKAVLACADTEACAVIVARDPAGQDVLVALCLGLKTEVEVLQRALANRLPDYMVPGCIAALDQMPLTANGKRDRKALIKLAKQALSSARVAQVHRMPLSEDRAPLARIWEDVTKRQLTSDKDHFFEMGATSMQAVQFITAVRAEFEVDLPLARLFEAPTFDAVWSAVSHATSWRNQ